MHGNDSHAAPRLGSQRAFMGTDAAGPQHPGPAATRCRTHGDANGIAFAVPISDGLARLASVNRA